MTATGLYQAVRDVAGRRPDAVAVRITDGACVTYRELVESTDRVAAGLAAHGVAAGDTVAVVLRNSIGYVCLILAVARLGARYVPLMANFDDAGGRTALDRARPALLVTDGHRRTPADGPTMVDLDTLTASTPRPEPTAHYPADSTTDSTASATTAVFRLLWTSGSTGFPKMMAWRQDRFVTERRRWLADTGIRPDDVFFCRHTLDVAHATDLHVFAALLSGAQLVLADPHAPAGTLLAQLAAHRATVTSALPQHYAELVAAARHQGRFPLPALRRPLCGGAYLSPAIIRDAADVLGVHIRQIYGTTEFGLALGNMDDVLQTDTAMVPVRGVGTRLEPFVPGHPDVGELVLYSDCTSEGYVDAPQANARTFRRPEFWTGDVAERTPQGGYRILGRVSETLATRDGPLPAPVLDTELATAEAVAQAVSLAVHPGDYRDAVAVAVAPADGHSGDEAVKAVEELLARHGLTGSVHLVTAIPRTPVGKIDKPLLRTRLGLAGGCQ
ncbi:class I adenylate-forming enzyme family protein [Micromonospora sp. LOL_021]|uniref:class I adenylate-forming enzyme family protein n=1 Tax=Micromonospora sp. LOL_021 TaxID=3345417 RepID=UPI003A881D2C